MENQGNNSKNNKKQSSPKPLLDEDAIHIRDECASLNTCDTQPDINTDCDIGFGATLQQARNNKNLSTEQIADQLKISTRYLNALEDEDINTLPDSVYTIGFLRSYAIFLDLRPGPLIEQIKNRLNKTAAKPVIDIAMHDAQLPATSLVIKSAVLAVLLLTGWNFFPADLLETVVPLNAKSLTKNNSEANANPDGKKSLATKEKQDDDPLESIHYETEDEGANDAHVSAEKSAESVDAVADNKATPEENTQSFSHKTAEAEESSKQEISIAEFKITPPEKLHIKAISRSWIELRDKDGAVLVNKILQTGEHLTFSPEHNLSFSTGNAAGICLENDSSKTAPLGSSGKVLRDIEIKISN